MAEEVNLNQLKLLHPKLRPYVKVLLMHEFGLMRSSPNIHSVQCGSIIRKNQSLNGDRFQLRILYCQKPLNWHVLMNCNDITKAPDFIMEENFLADLTPETFKTKVPSLANWCPTDVRCLLNVVLELLQLYKSYQVNLLRVNPCLHRYLFEYDILLSMAEINENDIELWVQPRNPTVIFFIHLNVDFSKLPTALPNSKDLSVLVVEFKEKAKNSIQLFRRLELEKSLGEDLVLPDLLPNFSLLDHIPEVELMLQSKVQNVVRLTHERKMLYSYLVQIFEPALINGDNINFTDVFFLLEMKGWFFVLKVHIPLNYPQSHPVLEFLSFHKSSLSKSNQPPKLNCNEKMSHEEIARCIFNFVKNSVNVRDLLT